MNSEDLRTPAGCCTYQILTYLDYYCLLIAKDLTQGFRERVWLDKYCDQGSFGFVLDFGSQSIGCVTGGRKIR